LVVSCGEEGFSHVGLVCSPGWTYSSLSRFYPVPNDATLAKKTPLNKTPSKRGNKIPTRNEQTNKTNKTKQNKEDPRVIYVYFYFLKK
jgi:hypothetical protein